ncbi:choice-of-anchor L domain-containing protein [Winogradskyella sp.]|uniref:choice-of-anchor L domain-containing protein n=1 Tax=Winogradskyella sp. TaxID=1883156 RepID=UPI003F6D2FD3
MKKKSIYIFLFFLVHIIYLDAQQIVTDNSLQPQQLIENLIGDNCVEASNITSSINGEVNNIVSYGLFNRGTSNFPLANGLVLSTGNVTSAGNGLIPQSLSDGELDWTTDQDILNVLGIDQTLNATSVEFDFISANNFVAFKYLFASDEYQQEYPCDFRDVFAILIKPTGSTDPYVNIALIPDTATVVSTNTIRPDINGFCAAQNENFFQGYGSGDTNFNGRTTVMTANAAVVPGNSYHVKFVIADHIDERFDSAVFIEADSFGGAIDLGPDQSVCGNALDLDPNISNTAATYTWSLNGNVLAGENNPTLQVSESGTYDVEVTIPISGGTCTLSDTIEVEVQGFQPAALIDDIIECDPAPSDGITDFDFTQKNDEIYNNLPSTDYMISYHLSLEDAENNDNPIVGIYQNTELLETIYVRIESQDDSCLQVGWFDIIIKAAPNTLEIDPVIICDQIYIPYISATVDFDFYDFRVANFEFNRTVTFHFTEEEAENGENAIPSPYPSPSETQVLYARVVDDFNGCHSTVPFTLEFNQSPFIGNDNYILNKCIPVESDYDSSVVAFNLNEAIDLVRDFIPDPRVNFYPTAEDALAVQNGFLFADEPIFAVSAPLTTIYMSVAEIGGYCTSVVPLELHKNIAYNILGEQTDVNRCDDMSADGIIDFDLNEVTEELIGGYADLSIVYYLTEDDQLNGVNPINTNIPLTVDTPSRDLYVRTQYKNECENVTKVTLNVNPPTIVQPRTADACGNFNAIDGTTTIDLSYYVDIMEQGVPFAQVRFYETFEDAENSENEITSTYNIPGNTQTFYTRVANGVTDCYDITTLDITVVESLNFITPEDLIICDNDQDGFSIVNLESILPQLSSDLSEFTITYYESYEFAVQERDPIENPTNYNTDSGEVFIRLERENLNCLAIIGFEILIYDNPVLNEISDFLNCQLNIGNSANFILEDKDDEILNGQTGMEVFYFETEADALNGSNPIDKTVAYQNTSNPQTIYVRLENEEQLGCFGVAPMQIEVRQAPIFNEPTDIPVCGTNGNGPYIVDLNEKISEISSGSPQDLGITFHNTPLNADLGANPVALTYTSTSNPELLYARIVNNASGCYNVTTFSINILDLPDVNFGQSLTVCGNNFETDLEWDLTEIELDILDGRQFNVEFLYYRSEIDAENESNPILNPEAYFNINYPETIYAKVSNVATGCYIIVPFDLNINLPPEINDFEVYNVCDNASSTINFEGINLTLLDNTFNKIVTYHATEADAESNENALELNYTYTNTVETLFARVSFSTTQCYVVYPFVLNVNPLPIANQPADIINCDDDYDGILGVDLNQQDAEILNGQNPDDFTVTYYNSENEAIENTNALESNYFAIDGEIIFVRVENNTTGCFDITQFSIIINDNPYIDIEDQVICLNDTPLIVSAETNNPSDSYLWSTNAITPEIEITSVGTYSVTITNEFGCETTSTFNVTESESADIDVVETIDFSDPNNITVTVSGIGNYLYQLNDLPFQDSNIFFNVPIGYNTLTIKDQNGCGRITKEVLVIDTPKHMSPNNDGDFDTWHITGVETLPGTIIHIFDRYGKLLKTLKHNTAGWDGTYNGNLMPTGDYWFVADVFKDGENFQVKGHFALKR